MYKMMLNSTLKAISGGKICKVLQMEYKPGG